MPSYNKVFLMGHLTRDPQLKYLPSQTALAEFGMACNRKFKTAQGEEREDVVFVDCAAFGKLGEVINQYCSKGKALFVEGRLKYDSWEDKQGGGKRSKISVVVENFQFLGGRDDTGGGGGSRGERPAASGPAQENREGSPFAGAPGGEFKEDDIPFACPAA
jgi:single-strand DNA-binding protein